MSTFLSCFVMRMSCCHQWKTGMMHDTTVQNVNRSSWVVVLAWLSHGSNQACRSTMTSYLPSNSRQRVTCWVSSKLDLITAYSHVNCVLWSHYHWHRFMTSRGGVWVHWYMSYVYIFPQLTIILVFSGPIWSSTVSPFHIFRKQLTEGQLSGLPMETIQLCCICFHWGL